MLPQLIAGVGLWKSEAQWPPKLVACWRRDYANVFPEENVVFSHCMQPVLLYSVKKLWPWRTIQYEETFGKKLRMVECRYSPPEEGGFSLCTQPTYLDFGFHLISCLQEACFKFLSENMPFWAIWQTREGFAYCCTVTITEQSFFFVVAYYCFCNANFLAMIRKLLNSSARCLHFLFMIYHDHDFEPCILP